MTEALAWIIQIRSDEIAAELLSRGDDEALRCQAIAKYQQIVEKSIRAVEAMLFPFEQIVLRARFEHYPERALNRLYFVPGAPSGLSKYIRLVLSNETKSRIEELCRLAPSGRPDEGQPFRKNTEYPYNIGNDLNDWTAPAAEGIFAIGDVRRFKYLAGHLHKFAEDVYTATVLVASRRLGIAETERPSGR